MQWTGPAFTEMTEQRYQSSNFTSKLAGLKLADLDGTRVTGLTSTWIAPPAG